MTANTATEVLIVGAGPTGLTLACELARRGRSIRIVEQSALPMCGSRGKGLQPRTLEVFDDLGIIDRILARGTPYPRMRAHLGPFSFRWDMMKSSARTEAIPYPNPWMVAQADTEAVLRELLAELGVTVEFGVALHAFEHDADGVRATLQSGTTSELVRCRYLVGADGGRSFVRKTLGLPLHGSSLEEPSGLVGDVYIEGLDRNAWHVWPRARGGPVALCPLPGDAKFQLLAQLKKGAPAPALELDAVRAFLANAIGDRKVKLRDVSWLSMYQPQARMVTSYRVGRVFLAGDAAHVHPPTGGQGLNIGVQDAQNLGWKLAAVLEGTSDTLLDTYQAERLPIARSVLSLSSALYRRDAKQRRGEETKQLGTRYRDSRLSVDVRVHASARLRAGDRAPDGVTSQGRLFDLFRGTHFSVLAFGEGAARAQPADPRVRVHLVSESLSTVDVHDPGGRIAASYQAGRDTVVVVRPDGYIAMRSDASHGFELETYLAGNGGQAFDQASGCR